MCVCVRVCVCVCVCMHMQICIHTYIDIYMFIYQQNQSALVRVRGSRPGNGDRTLLLINKNYLSTKSVDTCASSWV